MDEVKNTKKTQKKHHWHINEIQMTCKEHCHTNVPDVCSTCSIRSRLCTGI